MKRIILMLAMLGMFQFSANALVQGTIKPGAANSFIVSVRNIDAVAIVGNFAQYNAAIRVAQTVPQPTLTLTNLMPVGNVSILQTYTAGGYTYYNIYFEAPTGVPNNVNLAQNVELNIFSGTFTSGTGNAQVDLVDTYMFTDATGNTHTGTGTNQFTQFYINIAPSGPNGDATNYAARFYANGQSTPATLAAITSFVGVTNVPLSVNFSKIEAVKDNGAALVSWTTATEANNAGFDIERSHDGKVYSKIGFQSSKSANGNSSADLNYSFRDAQPAAGINYYRLKQVDRDGRSQYSTVVSVSFEQGQNVKLYPNPATDKLIVEAAGVQTIALYNLAGQAVSVPVTYGATSHTILTSGLAKGSYVVLVSGATGTTTHKLVLQ